MKAVDILSRQEILDLQQKSNQKATLLVLTSWAWVAGAFCLVALLPNMLTVLLALLIIGGRQLSFAIFMHDCGHNSLFKTNRLNNIVGTWLAAAPVFSDLQTYSRQHSIHHKDVGTHNDPDLANYANYPITRASLWRKILRDLCGLTALKFWFYVLKTRAKADTSLVSNVALLRALTVNLGLFFICFLLAYEWLYLLWIGAYNTTYFLFLRIRHVGEHAAVPNPNSRNMFENTRTTAAHWWEKLLVCPVYVNFHIEHHLLPSVPPYNLPKMHRLLVAKQAYKDTFIPSGYIPMLRTVLKN
ncbi:MAG: fatty acid desaturase [Paraglaciecola sp.]|jgi:fatty acid desaturase